ncbi:hypothetical protein HGA92_03615 [Candidatus Gracilibacteria bacterium]|nr:hypothetical protein [Candidatus Gracilibacteria bacterium]NUJ99186.1 hypothetical protein [Candidatus Gracilibacteria bacterium]
MIIVFDNYTQKSGTLYPKFIMKLGDLSPSQLKAFFGNQVIKIIGNLKIQENTDKAEVDGEYRIPEEYSSILSNNMLLPKEDEKHYPNNTKFTSIDISPENLKIAICMRAMELLNGGKNLDTLSLNNLRGILEYLEYEKGKITLIPKSGFLAGEIVNINSYR